MTNPVCHANRVFLSGDTATAACTATGGERIPAKPVQGLLATALAWQRARCQADAAGLGHAKAKAANAAGGGLPGLQGQWLPAHHGVEAPWQ